MRYYGRITSAYDTPGITEHTGGILHDPHFTPFPFHDDIHHLAFTQQSRHASSVTAAAGGRAALWFPHRNDTSNLFLILGFSVTAFMFLGTGCT
jgi:hypothetical protein